MDLKDAHDRSPTKTPRRPGPVTDGGEDLRVTFGKQGEHDLIEDVRDASPAEEGPQRRRRKVTKLVEHLDAGRGVAQAEQILPIFA
jgi:hypothetical protein